jgi:hypothetical protein
MIQMSNLTYKGAFRLPRNAQGNDPNGFAFGGNHLAFNPAKGTIFVGSRNNFAAEVSIPTPVLSADINLLPEAAYVQGLFDPFDGHLADAFDLYGVNLAGLTVEDGGLVATASIYYDAMNTQRMGHYRRGLGWKALWQPDKQGFVAGYMTALPEKWRTKFNATSITGQCAIPIVTRTSWGPAAFAFNANTLDAVMPLVYYPAEHPTLGLWEPANGVINTVYNGTMTAGGAVVIDDTLMVWGSIGTGTFGYGPGTSDPALAGTPVPDAPHEVYCYDPTSSSKGQHAYPYQTQVWTYDLNSLGTGDPWAATPATFNLTFPIAGAEAYKPCGVTYDPATRMLYVAQAQADVDGYSFRALIHAYSVAAPSEPTPAPEPPVVIIDPRIAELEAALAAANLRISSIRSQLIAIQTRLKGSKSTAKWLLDAIAKALAT